MEFRSPENEIIQIEEWIELMSEGAERFRIASTLMDHQTGKNLYTFKKGEDVQNVTGDVAKDDDLFISTVWTGMTIPLFDGTEVRNYETKVFRHASFWEFSEFTRFYETREEAASGHMEVLEEVRQAIKMGGLNHESVRNHD